MTTMTKGQRMTTSLEYKTVVLNDTALDRVQGVVVPGTVYHVEGLWTDVYGISWTVSVGNPSALYYAIRTSFTDLPYDDNVYYGKIGGLGYLVHANEIGEVVE